MNADSNPLLTVKPADDDGLFVCVGEIDMATSPLLAEAVAHVPEDIEVRFDFGGVTFIDSAGVRALIELARARPLRVLTKSPPVTRLFEMLGLDQAFNA